MLRKRASSGFLPWSPGVNPSLLPVPSLTRANLPSVVPPKFLRLASFSCVHRKADEGGIPSRMPIEENAARYVPGRREPQRDLGDTTLGAGQLLIICGVHCVRGREPDRSGATVMREPAVRARMARFWPP